MSMYAVARGVEVHGFYVYCDPAGLELYERCLSWADPHRWECAGGSGAGPKPAAPFVLHARRCWSRVPRRMKFIVAGTVYRPARYCAGPYHGDRGGRYLTYTFNYCKLMFVDTAHSSTTVYPLCMRNMSARLRPSSGGILFLAAALVLPSSFGRGVVSPFGGHIFAL